MSHLYLDGALLKKEFDFGDVDLDLGEVYVGLIDNKGAFLAEELCPLVVVLIAKEGD
jgi:hypothetical protein